VILCKQDDEICAGAIFSTTGTMGTYLSGATSDKGLKTNGSYLVQWAFVKWLKENGFSQYDLNGVNPDLNPGTYHFKRGLAGKHGRDVELLGKFQVSDGLLSDWVVKGGEWLMSSYGRIVRNGRALRKGLNKDL
jgi:lipid II:glycine glycyltransferase (peptidoglycan interpeptide bridge formation enzyme)